MYKKIIYIIVTILVFSIKYGISDELKNAIWLSDSWVSGKKAFQEIRMLTQKMEELQIYYLFPRAGSVLKNGMVNGLNINGINSFVSIIKNWNSDIMVIPWIYIPLKKNGIEILSDKTTFLPNLQTEISKILSVSDGVHIDIEPVSYITSKEILKDFLMSLRGTVIKDRKNQDGKKISAAIPNLGKITKNLNYATEEMIVPFFAICDQIVLMAYDTGLSSIDEYKKLIIKQMEVFSNLSSLSPISPEVLIGIPAYDDPSFIHNPKVENVQNAISAFEKGMSSTATIGKSIIGFAIYSEWVIKDEDLIFLHRFIKKEVK